MRGDFPRGGRVQLLGRVAGVALIAALGLGSIARPSPALAEESPAVVAAPVVASAPALHPLAADDLSHYRAAFAAQHQGDFAGADSHMAALGDLMLVGHLLYERYMDTARYRASPSELADWLAAYGDLPGVEDIEVLAAAGNPSGAGDSLPRPFLRDANSRVLGLFEAPLDVMPAEPRGRPDQSRTRATAPRIAAALRADRPDEAAQLLDEPRVGGRLDPEEQERARADIAHHYYRMGDDQNAYEMAASVADRSRAAVPMADWTAGLAAWRLGDPGRAAIHFAALADAENVSVWVVSAAAFWAARADLVSGRPERVLDHLTLAASYPNTFYGLMATRLLGRDITATPELGEIDTRTLTALATDVAVQRAAALAAIGQVDLASAELGLVRARLSPTETSGIDALAVRLGLIDAESHGNGRYPVPAWRPSEGLRVDRALLFAFAKQESGFNIHARSPVGAMGLMQLMPATARIVADRRGIDLGRKMKGLTDPGINLSLGQAYLEMLMENGAIGNNLFLVAAAYNAGPGNAQKWLDEVKFNGDPLLFIESIPAGETRLFIERILANFWIYQARLGQTLETLDAAASGAWPIYVPQDRDAIRTSTRRYAG